MDDFTADGQLNDIGTNTRGSENGISDLRAPINALVGIFLDDSQPNLSGAPRGPRFLFAPEPGLSRSSSRKLKQTFFIGDGLNSGRHEAELYRPEGCDPTLPGLVGLLRMEQQLRPPRSEDQPPGQDPHGEVSGVRRKWSVIAVRPRSVCYGAGGVSSRSEKRRA